MDRAVSIAKLLYKEDIALLWLQVANEIKEDVLAKGWKEEIQSFSQTYENTELDSSLLLMEAYSFITPEDERYRKTVEAVYRSLRYKGLMFRYNTSDDFGVPTSAFTICTFWMIRALFVIDRQDEARVMFDEMVSYSNNLGLFSEDLDFETKSQLGNFPQAYSHLALINTARLFAEAEEISRFIKP